MFGFLTLNTHLRITQWNPWLEEYTGVTEAQALGQPLEKLFPEVTSRGLIHALECALENRAPLTISHTLHEYIFPPAEGEPHPQAALIQPLIRENTLIGLAVAIQDVSDRVLAETELKRRIQHLEALRDIDRSILLEDLDAAFQRIVDHARTQFDALWCGIFLLEGNRFTPWVYTSTTENGFHPKVLLSGEGIIGLVARTGKARRMFKIREDPSYVELDPRAQAGMAAPIQMGGQVWGVLYLECASSCQLVGDALPVLESLAAEAAIVLQNDNLRRKEQRRVEAFVLLRELSLHLMEANDLKTLYNLGVRYAVRLLDASAAILYSYSQEEDEHHGKESTGLTFVAGPGVPGRAEGIFNHPRLHGLNHTVARTGEPMVVNDLASHPLFGPEEAKKSSFKALVSYPLLSQGQVIAVLTVGYDSQRPFDAEDMELMGLLSEQLVVQVERTRHRQAEARHMAELEGVHQISKALRLAQSVEEMLPILLEETLASIHSKDGSIWLYHPARELLIRRVARGWPAGNQESTLKPGEGIAGWVFTNNQPLVSRDFTCDQRVQPAACEQIPSGWGGACVPIRSTQEVIGVFFIFVELPRVLKSHEANLLTTLAEIGGTAIQRSRLHEETQRRLDYVTFLRSIETAITSSFDLRITLRILVQQALAMLQIHAVDIVLFDEELNNLNLAASSGFNTIEIPSKSLQLGKALAGRAIREQRTITLKQLARLHPLPTNQDLNPNGEYTYICLPLISRGKILGALEIFHRTPFYPSNEWQEALKALAAQTALALDNATIYHQMQELNLQIVGAYNATIEAWAKAVETRKKGSQGHIDRVLDLILAIARELKLPGEQVAHLRRGALLHDIGELIVPEDILNKPGPLDETEWKIIQRHPTYARDLLAGVDVLDQALEIPLAHHEKWDGSGYPLGLQNTLIPRGARIFTVVDVFDALTSPRPYRPAWDSEKALQYITKQAGVHFDPEIVEAFLHVHNESPHDSN